MGAREEEAEALLKFWTETQGNGWCLMPQGRESGPAGGTVGAARDARGSRGDRRSWRTAEKAHPQHQALSARYGGSGSWHPRSPQLPDLDRGINSN